MIWTWLPQLLYVCGPKKLKHFFVDHKISKNDVDIQVAKNVNKYILGTVKRVYNDQPRDP